MDHVQASDAQRFEFLSWRTALYIVMASFSVGIMALLHLGVVTAVPAYDEFFHSFGTDLPWITHWLLTRYPFFWLLAVASALSYVGYFIVVMCVGGTRKAFWRLVLVNLVMFIVTLVLVIAAIYAPLFVMGEMV